MSPKTMAALPKSPAGPRRSSSSGGLRPIIPLNLDDSDPNGGSAIDDTIEEEEPEPGPVPKSPGTYASAGGVDEVEAAYGYVIIPLTPALLTCCCTVSEHCHVFTVVLMRMTSAGCIFVS
jgi:hypothetical protein